MRLMGASLSGAADLVAEHILTSDLPERARSYPQLRFMGSKHRLLPWICDVLSPLEFKTALDAFSGSGAVSYLLKTMGKQVTAADFLTFTSTIATAVVENSLETLGEAELDRLLRYSPRHPHFIETTFNGIFFTPKDLRFLDRTCWNIRRLPGHYHRALATAALVRSCVKRQPRGVFTVAGDPERYKDGRRDLRLSLREHFIEQVAAYNAAVFSTGTSCRSIKTDVFAAPTEFDLVYLDPPYVPRADDNCYVKRYHFLEGLSTYWLDAPILEDSRVKKIAKPYTPFSYRSHALRAFDQLFQKFRHSTIVLSYSSNGFPDLDVITGLMRKYKQNIEVFDREHRYHFGTHGSVSRSRAVTREYLVVGR